MEIRLNMLIESNYATTLTSFQSYMATKYNSGMLGRIVDGDCAGSLSVSSLFLEYFHSKYIDDTVRAIESMRYLGIGCISNCRIDENLILRQFFNLDMN